MIETYLVIVPICAAIILLAQLVLLSAINRNHQELTKDAAQKHQKLVKLLDAALTMAGEALEERE